MSNGCWKRRPSWSPRDQLTMAKCWPAPPRSSRTSAPSGKARRQSTIAPCSEMLRRRTRVDSIIVDGSRPTRSTDGAVPTRRCAPAWRPGVGLVVRLLGELRGSLRSMVSSSMASRLPASPPIWVSWANSRPTRSRLIQRTAHSTALASPSSRWTCSHSFERQLVPDHRPAARQVEQVDDIGSCARRSDAPCSAPSTWRSSSRWLCVRLSERGTVHAGQALRRRRPRAFLAGMTGPGRGAPIGNARRGNCSSIGPRMPWRGIWREKVTKALIRSTRRPDSQARNTCRIRPGWGWSPSASPLPTSAPCRRRSGRR